MKKISALFLAVFMLMTVLPAVPTTVFAADNSFVNATFEASDTTTWTTVNTATISKASGGASGSGNALKTHIEKGAWSSIQDYGAASFAFAPVIGKNYILSADVKLTTCSATVPTKVSFVLKTAGGQETVVQATTDKTLSKTDWAHCTAAFTPTTQIASIEIRIGSGRITEIGEKQTGIFSSYTFEFLMDNLLAVPELERSDALSMDFEDGWYPNYGKVSDNTTVTWSDSDTLHNSEGAIHFSTTKNYGGVRFPLRAAVGNSYDISVWIKPDKTPASQDATFIVYSPVKSSPQEGTWNIITAQHKDNFEAGKWTLCTAKFTPDGQGTYTPGGVATRADVLEESDIELRLGSGIPSEVMDGEIAFMMDDFFVFPTVDNKADATERITGGNFSSEEVFEANWTYESDKANATWLAEGANGTTGSARMEITTAWGRLRTRDRVEMEFGRIYTMTFWAKAISEDAVNKEMYAYITYDGKALAETPAHVITKPAQEPRTLTKEWQKFTIDFAPTALTSEQIYPYLNFRVGTGEETVSYAVDEVSVVQKGDSNFGVGASCMRTANGRDVILQMNFTESTSKHFLYKIIRKTASGDEIVRTVKTTDNYVFLNETEYGDLSSVYFEVVGVDAYNWCSQKNICRLNDIIPADNIKLSVDQYIWTKDMPEVSATVVYDNQTQGRTLRLIGAQYSKDNELLCSDEVKQNVPIGEKLSWNVSIPAHKDAVKAKFFAWFDNNFGAATPKAEIEKITQGTFIYLDANSKESAEDGSFAAPYKSISNARGTLKDSVTNSEDENIYMIFKSGEYVDPSYSTVELTSQEYAANKNVIFTTMEGEKAQISGAKHIAGSSFSLYDSNKNIYRAPVSSGTKTRHLYVNGFKATRARSKEDAVSFVDLDNNYYKSLENKENYVFQNLGLTSTDTSFINYKYPTELELNFIENWRHQFVCPDTVTESTDAEGNTVVHFGFTDDGNKSAWRSVSNLHAGAKLPVYVENAYELLDEPGEWYLDTHGNENYLYYIPREFETVAEADFVLPVQNKLITLKGTPDAHAKNVSFKNLDFVYTTWNYPTDARAFINDQNAFFTNPEGGRVMPGALEIYDASGITVDNCDFKHIGSQGLKMTGAIQHSNVIGNEFYDISGLALTLGDITHVDYAHKDQIVNPTDPKYYITDNLIANNYIHKIATDFYSASAIGVGFPVNTTIRNNEITDCPYSGIHAGYGWASYASTGTITKNFVIEKNYIHDILNWRLFDGGAIYTLGATGGTLDNMNQIRRNYFDDIKNGHGAVYPDEGSTYWEVSENVINQQRYPMFNFKEGTPSAAFWLHIHAASTQHIHMNDNYSTTANYKENGTYNQYEKPILSAGDGNWPDAAQRIIDEAGIEKAYQPRFDFDVQSVRVPRVINLKTGEVKPYAYEVASSKKIWDMADLDITVKNTNPDVVEATQNLLTAKTSGKSWITLVVTRKENGKVVYYDEHAFCVIVG